MSEVRHIRRIALVTDGIQPYVMGGMQQHSYSLARHFARKKIEVDLYHFNRSGYELSQLEFFSNEERKYIHSIEVPFPVVPKLPGHYLRASWKHSAGIYQLLIKRPSVDFIYIQGLTGLEILRQKSKGKKLPATGINFHGLEMFQPTQGVKSKIAAMQLRRLVKFCFHHSDFVFSFGGKIRDIVDALGIPKERVIESPLGIEAEWISTHPLQTGEQVRFLFSGRYERRKGLQELNQVLPSIFEKYHAEIHFAGPIPESARIHHPLAIYHGSISDRQQLMELYRSCDVLVLPSLSEGMPNVLLEAMASGLTIIATDVGAVSQVVHPEHGWIVPPTDIPAMRQALMEACENPNRLNEKREGARKFVKTNLLWEQVMTSLLGKMETACSQM